MTSCPFIPPIFSNCPRPLFIGGKTEAIRRGETDSAFPRSGSGNSTTLMKWLCQDLWETGVKLKVEAEFISQPRTQKFGDTEQVTGPPYTLLSPPIKWADIIPLMIMRTQRCEKAEY